MSILEGALAVAFAAVCLICLMLLVTDRRGFEDVSQPSGSLHNWRRGALVRLLLAVVVVLTLLPWMIQARRQAIKQIYNSPRKWVSQQLAAERHYANFTWRFNELDSVVVSWPGCNIDDSRLDRLAQELTSPADPERLAQCERFFGQVLTGPAVIRDLTASPLNLSEEEAITRLRGVLVGPDRRSSCAIVRLLSEGVANRAQTLGLLREVAVEASGLPPEEVLLGGAPVDGVTIDQQSTTTAARYSIPANLLVLVLCMICLRSWRLTTVVFGLGIFAQLLTVSLTHWCGYRLNAIFLVMPPLLLVLTVSAGVHLVNYFYDEVRRSAAAPNGSVARRAIAKGWLPCTMAATTTVVGLLSLLASRSPPIAQFGAISSLTIVVIIGMLFLMLPGAMEYWASPRFGKKSAPRLSVAMAGMADRWTELIVRFRVVIIVACLAAMALGGYGLTTMQMSVSIRSLFRPDSDIVQRYQALEHRIGPLVAIETIVRVPKSREIEPLQRARLISDVEQAIGKVDEVGGIVSAATFLPELSDANQNDFSLSLFVAVALRDRLQRLQFVDESQHAEYWRVSARISALDDIDYGNFLDEIAEHVEPVLDDARQRFGANAISASYTGAMPMAYTAQRSLLSDLVNSFLTALVLIALVMIAYLRSIRAGLVVMLPNLFPTVVLFGFSSLMGIAINIGSVMTASVALGIAVDDTLHFVTWFRRELGTSGSRVEAVRRAYGHCAKAMVQSTLICGLGLLVYALSPFVPTQRFALMMLTLLLAALVGDLVFLPAILGGPLGEWLRPRQAS